MMSETERPVFIAKEWDAGGSIFCYGSKRPRAYVTEIFTKDTVDGTLLQKAIDKTLERMPYYKYTLVLKKGLYHYADNDLPLLCAESEQVRTIGGKQTNYHMLDVTYYKNKISFGMFHGFCDGLGINRFIEAVLYHYFCAKDRKQYSDEGIITEKIPYDPAEEFDVYAEETKVSTKELKKIANSEKRYRLPELDEEGNKGPKMYRLPFKIKTEDFLSWCKENKTSPAAAVSAITAKAIDQLRQVPEGVIMSVVPVSLRKAMHAEKTFKNCSAAVFMPVKPEDLRTKPLGEVAADLRVFIKEQNNENFIRLLSSSVNFVTHLGRKVPTYWLKKKVLSMPETHPQDTVTVDYVGGLTTNDYSDQITEVRYLNTDVYNGSVFVLMSETAGYFHVNFAQTFASDCYYQAFLNILDEQNIPYEKLPYDTYLNPEVDLTGWR